MIHFQRLLESHSKCIFPLAQELKWFPVQPHRCQAENGEEGLLITNSCPSSSTFVPLLEPWCQPRSVFQQKTEWPVLLLAFPYVICPTPLHLSICSPTGGELTSRKPGTSTQMTNRICSAVWFPIALSLLKGGSTRCGLFSAQRNPFCSPLPGRNRGFLNLSPTELCLLQRLVLPKVLGFLSLLHLFSEKSGWNVLRYCLGFPLQPH